jgi:hypothetical protein
MKKIFFHVGFPKSASTTLQKQLFDKHSKINYLGVYPTGNVGQDSDESNTDTLFKKNYSLQEFHSCLTDLEGVEYYFSNIEKYFQNIVPLLSNDKINVFSNEGVVSVLFAHKDRAEKAKRIKQFFPDAKIIIIIRSQLEIIKSQYRDHPFDPRNLYSNQKNVTADEWVDRDFKNFDVSFLNSIDYYKVAKYYSDLFGHDNVGIFLFEEMVHDLGLFSKKISNFLNIDEGEARTLLIGKHENEGASKKLNDYRKIRAKIANFIPKKIKYSAFFRRLDKQLFQKLKRGKKQKINFKKETTEKIYAYYCENNKRLSKEYGLELEQYGYML